VPVCAYDTTGQLGATWFAYCGVNPAWLIRHEGVSKLAKFDIALAKATFACGSHSLAAPAGPELTAAFEECINDTVSNNSLVAEACDPGQVTSHHSFPNL
jgi:hypothetical protein